MPNHPTLITSWPDGQAQERPLQKKQVAALLPFFALNDSLVVSFTSLFRARIGGLDDEGVFMMSEPTLERKYATFG